MSRKIDPVSEFGPVIIREVHSLEETDLRGTEYEIKRGKKLDSYLN